MSGAGVVYAAQCEEKFMRVYIITDDVGLLAFSAAAKKRICVDAGAADLAPIADDLALTQGL